MDNGNETSENVENPEKKEPIRLPNRSTTELKKIAMDMSDNLIFTSLQIPEHSMSLLGMIFMPILFGGAGDIDPNDIGMIYEYYSKAGPRCINGFPTFISCSVINKADSHKIVEYYEKFQEIKGQAKAYVELDEDKEKPANEPIK